MEHKFQGWDAVISYACQQEQLAKDKGETAARLNRGQRASIRAIAERITRNGLIVADEVGMGKTRIAVEVARSVVECSDRVVVLVPPGLG
jgi:primosomal protein N'